VRTLSSLLLIFAQLANNGAAALSVCTNQAGQHCIDFGAATCHCCQPIERHSTHGPEGCCPEHHDSNLPLNHFSAPHPCTCEHRPLVDESQLARRLTSEPREKLLAANPALWIEATSVTHRRVTPSAFWSPRFAGHTPLADLGTIALRC
jgi:hypothetical protein